MNHLKYENSEKLGPENRIRNVINGLKDYASKNNDFKFTSFTKTSFYFDYKGTNFHFGFNDKFSYKTSLAVLDNVLIFRSEYQIYLTPDFIHKNLDPWVKAYNGFMSLYSEDDIRDMLDDIDIRTSLECTPKSPNLGWGTILTWSVKLSPLKANLDLDFFGHIDNFVKRMSSSGFKCDIFIVDKRQAGWSGFMFTLSKSII